MHIAFDAKRAFENGTGLGHYSRTLIRSLAYYYPQNTYNLVAPKVTERFDVTKFSNIQVTTPAGFPDTYMKALWRSKGVAKELKAMQVDLYHGLSHEIPVGIGKTGIPSVVTMHDLIFERYPQQYKYIDRKIYRKKFLHAAQHAQTIIAISAQTKKDLINIYNVPEKKIEVCYQSYNPIFDVKHGVAEKQRVKDKYGLPDVFFLYVGSIIERKNLLTICKAMTGLRQTCAIPLVVIGEGGTYKKLVQAYIKEKGLENSIIFLADNETAQQAEDYKSAKDFPAIYQSALAMIYPSYFEGFGIPVLEALATGLPVITSNVSCLPEAGGDAAIYVNPSSVQEMETAMLEVAHNNAFAKAMREKGWAHARNFGQRVCAEAVMRVYKTL